MIAAHANDFVEVVGDRATVIGDDGESFADLRFARACRKVDVTVLFREAVDFCVGVFADVAVAFEAVQIGRKRFTTCVEDAAVCCGAADNRRVNFERARVEGHRARAES